MDRLPVAIAMSERVRLLFLSQLEITFLVVCQGIKSKSKNDTWSEEELSRHLMHKGSPETKLNKTSPDTYGYVTTVDSR